MNTMTVEPAALRRALGILAKAKTRSSKKVFESVLVRWPWRGGAMLVCTDLEHCAVVELPVVGMTGIGIAAQTHDALASLGKVGGPIRFSVEDAPKNLQVVATWDGSAIKGCKRVLDGCDPAEFPEVPLALVEQAGTRCPGLGAAIEEGKPYTGREAARFVLNGQCITPEGWLVATDGRRLFRQRFEELDRFTEEVVFPVPKLAARDLETVDRIAADSRTIAFFGDRFTWLVRKLDGVFPDHRQIVPPDGDAWPVPAEALAEAVQVALETCSTENNAIRLDYFDQTLTVQSANGDGRTEINIPLGVRVSPMRTGINGQFLRELLSLRPDTVRTRLTAESGPVATRAMRFALEGGRDVVVMPVLLE